MSQVTYRRSRKPGCFTLLLLLALGLLLALWLTEKHAPDKLAGFSRTAPAYGEDELPRLTEIWSEGSGPHKVVRIPIAGMIHLREDAGFLGAGGSTALARQSIRRATRDRDVLGLILEVDSGGGGITASDVLFHELLRFKAADPRRVIVAHFGDVAASGAYYLSLAADHIIAHPTSITGSLGVMIQSLNFKDFADRHGIRDVTVKSGENKDLLNPLGEMSPEQISILKEVIDAMHQRFIGLVAEHRPMDLQQATLLADGRIFTAEQALENHLIDELGYWQDAVAATRNLLAVDDLKIYRYESSFSIRQFLRASSRFNLRSWLEANRAPPLQYRWKLD